MLNLYNTNAIREMERAAFKREESYAWMTRAGDMVAGHARQMMRGDIRPVLVLAGPGNNGGDAFVAACKLRDAGRSICLVFAGDESKLSPDAARAFAKWQDGGGEVLDAIPAGEFGLAIDGLFGIGLTRPLQDPFATLARQVRGLQTLSIDAPSGINTDTGAQLGESVTANRTVTFFAAKTGLCTGDGLAASGDVRVESLGFDIADTPIPSGVLLTSVSDLQLRSLHRAKNTHKGTFGETVIVGGATGMSGALALASRAAVRMGSGKVFALSAAAPPLFDFACPEVMWRQVADLSQFTNGGCIAIGPGLGEENAAIMRAAVHSNSPLVADADALNILSADPDLMQQFAGRNCPSVMTPHPAEAARLLKCQTADVQNNRVEAAKTLAEQYNAVTVLKGAGSIVAEPQGQWTIISAGNPGLAQAGAGDVLTGMIAALIAQTRDCKSSACTATFLHAAAADHLAREKGMIGLDLNQLAGVGVQLLNRAIGT